MPPPQSLGGCQGIFLEPYSLLQGCGHDASSWLLIGVMVVGVHSLPGDVENFLDFI